jgi:hypothetical protein
VDRKSDPCATIMQCLCMSGEALSLVCQSSIPSQKTLSSCRACSDSAAILSRFNGPFHVPCYLLLTTFVRDPGWLFYPLRRRVRGICSGQLISVFSFFHVVKYIEYVPQLVELLSLDCHYIFSLEWSERVATSRSITTFLFDWTPILDKATYHFFVLPSTPS